MKRHYIPLFALAALTFAGCSEPVDEISGKDSDFSAECGDLQQDTVELTRAEFDKADPAAIQQQLETVALRVAATPGLGEQLDCLMQASASESDNGPTRPRGGGSGE